MKPWFSDPFAEYLQRIVEEQRSLTRLWAEVDPMKPYRELLDRQDEVHRMAQHFTTSGMAVADAFRSLRPIDLTDQLLPSRLGDMSQEIEQALRLDKVGIDALQAITRSAGEDYVAAILSQREEFAAMATSLRVHTDSLTEAQRSVASALATVEASARLYDAPSAHWFNSLAVIGSFERFSIHQAARAKADVTPVAARRARVTELAGSLLASAVAASQMALSGTDVAQPQKVDRVEPRLFGPLNQHLGFVYRAELSIDIDPAFASALPTQIGHMGSAIVALVTGINERMRLRGSEDVFRPTNRALWTASFIPCIVVGSDEGFGEITEALYFLIYEAAGASNSRLVPLAPPSALEPLWRLKHLRLRYHHDVEHGSDGEIRKNYAKIAAAFRALIGKDLPSRPAEWTRCQSQLYAQLYEMLKAVDEKLAETLP